MQSKIAKSKQTLEFLFHPRSIAIIGVSSDMRRISGGRRFLMSLMNMDFKGKLYPVNLGGGEIWGLKIYPSLNDIPDKIDYVISAIPAEYVPQLLMDCAGKGVKAVHIFSAGFSEIADASGRELQSHLIKIARRTGIRIIGPNCMGLYYPKAGLGFFRELPKQSGPFGFISQSGGNSGYVIREGASRGICFSKVISYGNAADLDESDLLQYLAHDPETEVIAGYIEGVKDGRRFLEVLREAARLKPVILYKPGVTKHGIRAIASHTASLAGSDKVWGSLLKQVGAIQVHSIEELVDLLTLFRFMSPPAGRNIALVGTGGGSIVQSADDYGKAGLNMPLFPLELRQKLEENYPSEAGSSFRNPVDMYFRSRPLIRKSLKIIADYKHIDLQIIQVTIGIDSNKAQPLIGPYLESIISLSKEINLRSAVVLRLVGPAKFRSFAEKALKSFVEAEFPVFPSSQRAANAITRYIDYHQRRPTEG